MKQYIYSSEEAGFSSWPLGVYCLDGVTTVTDPDEADVFVFPRTLALFTEPSDLKRLPFYVSREQRHFFGSIDESIVIYDSPAIFCRCNLKTWMKARDVNSVSWPWPAENYAECVDVPEGGFLYDVSFQGWLNYATRFDSTQACLDHPGLKSDMNRYPNFTGAIYYDQEGIRRRKEYRRSMKESRVCLCPESIPGDFPYRFFEAMSAGRVPVMVGRHYILPFAEEIPYSEFIVEIDLDQIRHTGSIIRNFLDANDDAEIIRRGLLARHYWEQWLAPARWGSSFTYVVEKALRRAGHVYEPTLCPTN